MVVVRGNSAITSDEMVQLLFIAVFVWLKSDADDSDEHTTCNRLERLRENLRNLTEGLGYRLITHPAALLWQSPTAAKLYISRHGIPNEIPLICDHTLIHVDLEGMGCISTTRPLISLRELPWYNRLHMELVGSQATIQMIRSRVDSSDVSQHLTDVMDLFWDVIHQE